MKNKLKVLAIAYHRNGIGGAPFNVIIFSDDDGASRKLAIVFDAPYHVAVLDIAKLAELDVRFGSNSWRGDEFEPGLRAEITRHWNNQP